ncbi:phosphate acyltransferase PlsX [bacterium]|nr:phosphate acyltransferase PlsX [bacterium]
MRIAVDAMGGDNAPSEIVKGVLEASLEIKEGIVLVGKKEEIEKYLPGSHPNITIQDAREVIGMDESPVSAIKKKTDASIAVAAKMVRRREADAVVTAGNTGVMLAAGITLIGRLRGIERPAIACLLPSKTGQVLLLDAGANVDCKPTQLFQFGIMGKVYAEEVLGIQNPRVSLLNIGEEEGKGNRLTDKAAELLSGSAINFCGNIEGRDIILGKCDVVVCDGFVGNSLLKFGEGIAEFIIDEIRQNAGFVNKIGLLFLKGLFRNLLKKIDYAEYGGAPLLGLEGVSIICHGRSKSKAIKNAIKVASIASSHHINDRIEEELRAK